MCLPILAQVMAVSTAFAGEVVKVKMADLGFSPQEVTISVGDTIEWVNEDFVDHTATETKNVDWNVNVPAGSSGSMTFDKVGSIDYYCVYHPQMTGKIHVVAKK
jgi:plastocyanin